MKHVARDKLTTGTRFQNAEQHSLETGDFPTRRQDRYISRRKIGTPCEMNLSPRKDKNCDS